MLSPFEQALAKAEQDIQQLMMNEWLIQNQPYPALLDESPNVMGDDPIINGTCRTLTLFKSSGYQPKLGHQVSRGQQHYVVRGFSFSDELIILQLE
ncbi:phage tail protein [Volucribacter amazonae]|uniref:Phage tail protein n=1 Tax=Volucribacter amazonae TaxID=256731 RepID=A0A9X4P8N3_9PAST|nr:phage tail protein [Volucribacter amazonae]MDG6894528.1 phage tail protein [Volucribacter amazonae]